MTETNQVHLHAYIGYQDAPAAIGWLEHAFGFRATSSFPDERGGIAHAELRVGDAAIVVFSDHDGYRRPPLRGETTGHGYYLNVADPTQVDAAYPRALDSGGTGVWEPGSNQWGNYRCRVIDPEGIEWTLGTYRPG
ncbi:VOC family protein [Pseudonocardia acaciae]|uniref:VOC family protein n=1 Tax=Pseudonocardia acaciae TaxID=551276 RepID=UPI00048EC8D5|nr:VOC family protein [Pseudonocardia acaciae]